MPTLARIAAMAAGSLLLSTIAAPAWAAAPLAPVLVGPANGSTSTTAAVPLSVSVSDPDGGSLTVRFEGRRTGATVPGGAGGDPFTIVALPDTQNYTYNNRQSTMVQQTQWVVNTRSSLNTAMVVQLGDLVSEYDNLTQWGHTSTALAVLDDAYVPNTVVAGNHDFNNATGAFTQYDTYFPPSRYAGKPWTPSTATYGGYLGQNLFGPDPVDRRNMDNFALFSAGGRDFIVLNLEWEAPQYVLDWATKVLAAYPDRLAIVTTHAFVGINGQRRTTAERPGGTPANQLWTGFISQRCQIRLVLSGHFHDGNAGEANRSDLNACGQPVQQILTDYQDRANGGDGWLRYYTFNPTAATMTATTYSPKLDQFETDADSAFTVPFDLSQPQPAPFSTIATVSAPSGSTASATWTGLEPNTGYDWRAVVSDGTASTTSATWTVRTPVSPDYVDDTFTRSVSNGWGAADGDHAWTTKSTASAYSVDGSAGRITAPVGSTRGATLSGVSAGDVRVSTDLAMAGSASGSGTYVSLHGRLSGANSYRTKLRYLAGGGLSLSLISFVGSEVTIGTANVAGVTATPGLKLRLVLELEGTSPTTLRTKVWPVGATEPAAWTLTATDSTGVLQAAGTTGLDVYTSGTAAAASAVAVDRFTASRLNGTPPANQPPDAVIAAPTIDGLRVDLAATGSTDPDGTITTYAWNYGDNTTGTGPTTSHTYTQEGTYTITLVVTDDDNATDTATRQVTVTAPAANQPPDAVIAAPTIDGLRVDLAATGSTDPDGTITAYAWNYGDNTTGTGPTTSHTYTQEGTYTITLVVTDDDNATDTATRQITVTAPGAGPLAADSFGRTVTGGWGAAATGGNWSVVSTASRYAVGGGTGQQILGTPGVTTYASLNGVSSASTDLRMTLSWSRTAATGVIYTSIVPRRVNANDDYRCKIVGAASGAMQLHLVRRVGGTETTLASTTVAGLTLAAGQDYQAACRAVRSGAGTQVAAKLWRSGSSEPGNWQLTAADTTAALQQAGGLGVSAYNSSSATQPVTLSVDNLVATAP